MKGNTLKQRAAELNKALNALYDPFGKEDNVTDMLTDLRHLCLVKNWDFFRCDRVARDHAAVEQHAGSLSKAEIVRPG